MSLMPYFLFNRHKQIFWGILMVFLVGINIAMGQSNAPWIKVSPTEYLWKDVGNGGFSESEVEYTSLGISNGGQPYLAFQDFAASGKLSVMKFEGGDWVYEGPQGFTSGEAQFVDLAFNHSGELFVAYEDITDSNRAAVMKFNGTSWVPVGGGGFSIGEAAWISLAFNQVDEPFVAFKDVGNGGDATVMKFDGNNWIEIGNAGFSEGQVWCTSLAFCPEDSQPFVAFQDDNTVAFGASVMKFNGTNWEYVGIRGFSTSSVGIVQLAFNPEGNPYVAFCDGSQGWSPTVMRFDGDDWIIVGNAGFIPWQTDYLSFAFSSTGEPYLAFQDDGFSKKASVMKFDGIDWQYVGNAGFSSGMALYTSLSFSPTGQPYVAYKDFGNSMKATAMQYDSVFVGIHESWETPSSIHPNPASATITIETSANGILSVHNTSGQQLLQAIITKPSTTIDVSWLKSGIYVVKLIGKKGVQVGKMIRQ